MKKFLILAVVVGFIASCGVPKTVIQSKKVIKGTWTLSNISYSESGNFNTVLFNDATKECFENSAWRFIPNNNSGSYSINDGACATGDRNFIFTIQEIDADTGYYDFLLKPTDAKGKSETNAGFRLRLTQLSDSNMQWEQTVNAGGSPLTINMNFDKTIE
jgi:hypothetical protein